MEDAAVLSESLARVAAELSALLSKDATVPNASGAEGLQDPADRSRAALEAYLHDMRMSEQLARPVPGNPDRRAA